MNVLIPSEELFENFVNNKNIILGEDYESLKNYYKYNLLDIEESNKYFVYFKLFEKYYHLKSDINLIYYIIILFYFNTKNLLDFIRFYTAKINYYNFNSSKIVKYSNILNKSKLELIKYLKNNIDSDIKNLYLFIYCIQHYI
jgi:hypothetical protein